MTKSKHAAPPRVKSSPTPATKHALPTWIEAGKIRDATVEQLLLFGLAGGRWERSLDSPLLAMAERNAADVGALHKLLRPQIDDLDVADLLQGVSERVSVLAALMRLVG